MTKTDTLPPVAYPLEPPQGVHLRTAPPDHLVDPSDIAALVDALDAADPQRRQKAREKLVAAGSQAVDTLAANLPLVDREQQQDVLRILAEIGDNRALDPSIEFFHHHRDKPGNAELRAEAVDTVLTVASEQDVDLVFEFLVDAHTDPDPVVRSRVIEGFGRVAGERARPFIEKAHDDESPQVRQAAQRVDEALESGQMQPLGDSSLTDRQLVERLRLRAGSQLEYYRRELLSRDNAFELARALLQGDRPVPMRAFRLLQSIDDDRVRELATEYIDASTDDGPRSAALRLLADRFDGDATPDEADGVRDALKSGDSYVRLAAIEAAGASGDPDLLDRAIRATKDPDEELALTAAEALGRGLSLEHANLTGDIASAVHRARDRRREDATPDRVKTEAYLLRALRRVSSPEGAGFREALDVALESLSDGQQHRPILVTGLTLIGSLIPEPLPEHRRLPADRLTPLENLKEHPDDAVGQRATDLLERIRQK